MKRRGFIEELIDRSKDIDINSLKDFLKENINEFQERVYGARIGVSFYDLRQNAPNFSINGNKGGWAASTIKIPVMIETFRAIDKLRLSLEDKLVVDHRYALEQGDLVSQLPEGKLIDVKNLLYLMITGSDNEATNMLINAIGLENINRTMKRLGANRTMLGHLLAYNVPRITTDWNPDGSNLTTPKDMSRLLSLIYKNKVAGRFSCNLMKSLLEKSSMKPLKSYLPDDTVVGNKIGVISDPKDGSDFHDVGVINRDYALAIMCNRIKFIDYSQIPRPQIQSGSNNDFRKLTRCNSIEPFEFVGGLSKLVYALYYKNGVLK